MKHTTVPRGWRDLSDAETVPQSMDSKEEHEDWLTRENIVRARHIHTNNLCVNINQY